MTGVTLPIDLSREPAFRLAAVDVRPATREVLGLGQRRVLEPRVMQVLVALARRRGEVVSRDELISACWRGLTVGDDAVSRCVSALRRLAESWGGLAIETIARVGYRLDVTAGVAAPRRTAGGGEPEALVAVLLFDDLSEAHELGGFCEGVSDEILHAVARETRLKVIGRASSFCHRGMAKAAPQVAEALGATHVLDGSVKKAGPRVRILAHLIECEGQTVLWSERFDRELTDVFALQDAIAEAVAAALAARL